MPLFWDIASPDSMISKQHFARTIIIWYTCYTILSEPSTCCWTQSEPSLACPVPHRAQAHPLNGWMLLASTLTWWISLLSLHRPLHGLQCKFVVLICILARTLQPGAHHSSCPPSLPCWRVPPFGCLRLQSSLSLRQTLSMDFIPLIFPHKSILFPWRPLFCLDYSLSHLFISSSCTFNKWFLIADYVLGTKIERWMREAVSFTVEMFKVWTGVGCCVAGFKPHPVTYSLSDPEQMN